ncbi:MULTISPECIES: acetyl-CoA carboxylase biotin carboxyl carrier protein subunit [Bacillaceae]|uniref:Acetyl-CoA carboxylase biotin carboxyl carrier protein n=1 Tax=Peribacillus huizhouensis TaxID=1501239 RepID=A0ABR6CWV2_9BACI|nr:MULTISPECIES: acetyl-CoA carboxylase biotin carboxyl carrier protein subunit [Bacillaceae]MBA9029100.1 acetyl-CoA carboxylase biotin carboxyl carrier protein [Peribacillus huizhouensis]
MSDVVASMAGSVWKIVVSEGDTVSRGQEVIILESMKMEIPLEAVTSGKIKQIYITEGDFVNEGDVLAIIE